MFGGSAGIHRRQCWHISPWYIVRPCTFARVNTGCRSCKKELVANIKAIYSNYLLS